MKTTRKYFAVLIDEYGGMSGIITLHDLIETLVGDLYDLEDAVPGPEIQKTEENTFKILGSADLDDVAEMLDIALPTDTFDTFSGYVCDLIGRVPADGESFVCDTDYLKIQVHTVINHRVGETTVIRKENILSESEEETS